MCICTLRHLEKDFLTKLFSTTFFTGYLPFAPGSWGSLLTLILVWFLVSEYYLLLLALIILFGISLWVVDDAEKIYGKDARKINIDESLGMIISLLFLQKKLLFYLLAFILFRGLDTIKPPPLRSLENLKGKWGVIADDLLAGIYTNLILRIIGLFC
jgi:phosphatidylglycerophosphatase A